MRNQKTVRKTKSKRLALALALATVAALGSGCGQQAYNEGTVPSDPGATTNGGYPTGGTTSGNNPLPNPVATSSPTNGSVNYDFHFQTTAGATATQVGGGAMTVSTDTLLQLSITAGSGGYQVGTTGYTAGFNCEMFYVKAGSISQQVFVKKNNYTDWMYQYGLMGYDPCQGAQTTWTGDFSGTLGVGHQQSVTISVTGMQIDNCRKAGYPDDGGCGLLIPYTGYTVDGNIAVTTD